MAETGARSPDTALTKHHPSLLPTLTAACAPGPLKGPLPAMWPPSSPGLQCPLTPPGSAPLPLARTSQSAHRTLPALTRSCRAEGHSCPLTRYTVDRWQSRMAEGQQPGVDS